MDLNAAVGGRGGLTPETIDAALGGDLSVLGEREALVVEYADRVTATPVDVPDAFFERIRAAFDERAIVELTATIAHESMNAKFNRALRIESNGFCAVPPRAPPAAPPSSPADTGG